MTFPVSENPFLQNIGETVILYKAPGVWDKDAGKYNPRYTLPDGGTWALFGPFTRWVLGDDNNPGGETAHSYGFGVYEGGSPLPIDEGDGYSGTNYGYPRLAIKIGSTVG